MSGAAAGPRKALFLDRDGTINEDRGYVGRREDFRFLPGVFAALREAQARGYLIVVVTNQSGIGRGLYSEADFAALTEWMVARLAAEGVDIAGVYHDPTHPTAAKGAYRRRSPERKPAPGLIARAAGELDIDLAESALIGDQESDIAAGRAAGVATTILLAPRGDGRATAATHVAESLADAVRLLA